MRASAMLVRASARATGSASRLLSFAKWRMRAAVSRTARSISSSNLRVGRVGQDAAVGARIALDPQLDVRVVAVLVDVAADRLEPRGGRSARAAFEDGLEVLVRRLVL